MFSRDPLGIVFKEPIPEELRCPFHRGIFQDPHVSSCGHSFCKACLHLDDSIGEEPSCPVCMSTLSGPFFPNLALVAIISHLRVHCKYRNEETNTGCTVVVTLGELPVHEASCEFAKLESKSTSNSTKSKKPVLERAPSQNMWHIDFREIKLLYRVGLGAFGEVFKASFRGTAVAVKRIIGKGFKQGEREEMFKREVDFMKSIRHPNIVLFVGACLQKNNFCIVTEFMAEGNLRDLIEEYARREDIIDWPQMVQYCIDAASGMAYLHGEGIIHRDVKSNNLLISGGSLKVSDFGLARVPEAGKKMSQAGNWAWMAPEMLMGINYTEKVDVYSYGIILAEVMTLCNAEDLPRTKAMTLDVAAVKMMTHVTAPRGFLKIIYHCCAQDPDKRPSFEEISEQLQKMKTQTRSAPNSDPISRRLRRSSHNI